MSDYLTIQEIGGADLVRHYPDRGQIRESDWYNAVLHIEPKGEGVVSWLHKLSIESHGFISVLSADRDGLRILVSLHDFAPATECPA